MNTSVRIAALATLAMTVTALPTLAQGQKEFGIVGGATFSTFTGSDAEDYSTDFGGGDFWHQSQTSKVGFVGGVYVAIPIGSSVVIEPELLYTQKGSKYDQSLSGSFSDPNYGEVTYKSDYLEVPVLARYNFNPSGGAYLLGGFSVGFNVSCSAEASGTLASDMQSGGYDPTPGCAMLSPDYYLLTNEIWLPVKAKTTFGAVLGLGYQKGNLGIEGRYDFDLGNAYAADIDVLGSTDLEVKNAAWEVLLRYRVK